MISPCINSLRHLVTSMNEALGVRQGVKHAEPNLQHDMKELRRSLADANVYRIQPGRTIDGNKAIVPNVVGLGLAHISASLRQYNHMFVQLKHRRQRTSPLVVEPESSDNATLGGSDTTKDARTAQNTISPNADNVVVLQGERQGHDDNDSEGEEDSDSDGEAEGPEWLEPEQFFSFDEEEDIDFYYE